MTEEELVDQFVNHFKKWFEIEREVKDDQKIGRIDLLIQDKVSKMIFGVECKNPDLRKGTDVGDVIQQAIQYSRLKFDGKRIPVFLVPSISHNQIACPKERKWFEGQEWMLDKHPQDHRHHTVNGLLGKFNVGEVRRIGLNGGAFYDFTFSNQVIYSTKKIYGTNDIEGLNHQNYTNLIRKINQWEETSRIFKTSA